MNNTLKTLVLDNNDFSHYKFDEIVVYLRATRGLLTLKLNSCRLSDERGEPIVDALHKATTMKELYLSGNKFTCAFGKYVS